MNNSDTPSLPDLHDEINHDMRNLLHNISALSVLLVQSLHGQNRNEPQQLAKMIRTLSQESLNLILNYTHMQHTRNEYGLKRRINVTNFLHERCMWLYQKSAWAKNIHFTFSIRNTALHVNITETDLYRIFDNLVSNAVKFTPAEGNIRFSCRRANNAMVVTITDSGIGIPADMHPFIFSDNRRTRRKGTNHEHSTGIGLLVVKKLVTENGGVIQFESEEDKGSTFRVSFPLAP